MIAIWVNVGSATIPEETVFLDANISHVNVKCLILIIIDYAHTFIFELTGMILEFHKIHLKQRGRDRSDAAEQYFRGGQILSRKMLKQIQTPIISRKM